MTKTSRNSQYNQSANVLNPTANITGDLTRMQESGQFSRATLDPAVAGGQSRIIADALQKGSDILNRGSNWALDQATTTNARNLQTQMLDTLTVLDQNLAQVRNTDQHREIYTNAIGSIKEQMGGATLLKAEDRFKFESFLKQTEGKYGERNKILNRELTDESLDNRQKSIANYLNNVKSGLEEQSTLIQAEYTDRFNALKEAGADDKEAKANSLNVLKQQILTASNSVANPKGAEDYFIALGIEDESGDFAYFKDLQGDERIKLQDYIKSVAGKNNFNHYNLQIAKDIPQNNREIESNPFLDENSKAILINRNISLQNQKKSQLQRQVLQNNSFDYTVNPEYVEEYLGSENFKRQTAKTGNEQELRTALRERHQSSRDKFIKDPAGILTDDARFKSLNRKEIINLQGIYGLKGSEVEIFSDSEKKQFSQIFNNAKTPDDKMAILNFDTPSTNGLLKSLNFKDPSELADFINKNKTDLIGSIKTISPHDKTAVSILSMNNDDPNAIQVAKKLFRIEMENKTFSKKSGDIKEFNENKLMKYLNSHQDTKEMAKNYSDAFSNSDISKKDFLDTIPLEPIENDKFDLLYNKNYFKEKFVKKTLNDLLTQDIYFEPALQKDNIKLSTIKQYGKWKNDGENFVYLYRGKPFLYAVIKDDEITKQKVIEPQLTWDK
jgi:hypothetical protein